MDLGDLEMSIDEIAYRKEDTMRDSVSAGLFRELTRLESYWPQRRRI